LKRQSHLLLICLRLWFDREFDHRIGKIHLLEDDRLLRVAERFTGRGRLEAGEGNDIAGIGLLDVFA
jgi:hypothetical protein